MGKLIDKLSYLWILGFFFFGVLTCWGLFYYLSFSGNGIVSTIYEDYTVLPLDSLYFSLVTISSLGYGDFRPTGYGRLVASLEVLYGLVILALIVSKIASERTSTLVKLIYTSDVQMRIRGYVEKNNKKTIELQESFKEYDVKKFLNIISELDIIFKAYFRFTNFHIKEGSIEGRWAEKIFLKLLNSTRDSMVVVVEISKINYLQADDIDTVHKCINSGNAFAQLLLNKYATTHFGVGRRQVSSLFDHLLVKLFPRRVRLVNSNLNKILIRYYKKKGIVRRFFQLLIIETFGKKSAIEGIVEEIECLRNSSKTHRERLNSKSKPQSTLIKMDKLLNDKVRSCLPDKAEWDKDTSRIIAKELRLSRTSVSNVMKTFV